MALYFCFFCDTHLAVSLCVPVSCCCNIQTVSASLLASLSALLTSNLQLATSDSAVVEGSCMCPGPQCIEHLMQLYNWSVVLNVAPLFRGPAVSSSAGREERKEERTQERKKKESQVERNNQSQMTGRKRKRRRKRRKKVPYFLLLLSVPLTPLTGHRKDSTRAFHFYSLLPFTFRLAVCHEQDHIRGSTIHLCHFGCRWQSITTTSSSPLVLYIATLQDHK